MFSDAIVAGVPTYFSFPAILASRYPLGLGRGVMGIAPKEATIATVLLDAGYRTAAFLAGNPYLGRHFGYGQGFEQFNDFLQPDRRGKADPVSLPKRNSAVLKRLVSLAAHKTRITKAAYDELAFWYGQFRASREPISIDQLRPYPAADRIVDEACSWLRSVGDGRFFLWIHLMDPHHPHYPSPEALSAIGWSKVTLARARLINNFWNRRELGASRLRRYVSEILALYDASIRWVDQQISRLTAVLQDLRMWDDTIFVLTGDHGEEFLEHGTRYHSPEIPVEQLIHVPLLLHTPGGSAVRLSHGPFSLIHLAPTALRALGMTPPESFQGHSHWEEISSGKLSAETAVVETVGTGENPCGDASRKRFRVLTIRDRQYKLVLRFEQSKDELYDLKNDPEERRPVPESFLVPERARLLKIGAEHLQKSRQNRDADLTLRARIREMRRSLPQVSTKP